MKETFAINALNQLTQSSNGIVRLVTMIGAKNFVQDKEKYSVQFQFMSSPKNKADRVRISLNSNDLYDVEFFRIIRLEKIDKGSFTNIYCDGLKDLFEQETALYLSF